MIHEQIWIDDREPNQETPAKRQTRNGRETTVERDHQLHDFTLHIYIYLHFDHHTNFLSRKQNINEQQ